MSGKGKYRANRHRNQHTISAVAKNTASSVSPDSPILLMFKDIAKRLNERQDRHERLYKLSRDITIESKRIIFQIHSAVTKDAITTAVSEAEERLTKLIQGPIKGIALELENSPAHLHSRAVTAGFQEYIEARTFCSLMGQNKIITYPEVQNEFEYKVENDEGEERKVVTMLPHLDYFLGLADLTGELMRRAINCISSGDSEECFTLCQLLRDLYTSFIGLIGMGRDLGHKVNTMRQSVTKVELAVYALRIRGGEAPPQLLLAGHPQSGPDWDTVGNNSDDEGFY
ncbi:translin-associated protein X-like [Manduca sexta]|nr:translin-associated protein X-like [Manduca sexta]